MTPKKKIKVRYIVIPLVVVVVAAAVVVLIARPFDSTTAAQYLTGEVARGTIEKTISSSGQLASGKTVSVSPKVSGDVKELQVKVGSVVEKGDTLFKISSDTIETDIKSAQQRLTAAQQQLTGAKQGLVAAQKAHVSTAKEILAQGSAGTGSSTGSGTGTGSGSGTGVSTGAGSSAAKPTKAEKKAAAEQAAESKANKARSIAQAKAEVSNATASVQTAQDDLSAAKDLRADAWVKAPSAGVVTAVNVANGDSVTGSSSSAAGATGATGAATDPAASGDSDSAASGAAVEIANYSKSMLVAVSATEAEIDSVKTGMKAVLTFDAFADLIAEGEIYEVSPVGSASGGLVTYPVKIKLTKPDPRLRPGMNAAAKIVLESAENVLMVPNTAISGDADAGYTVQVATGGDTTNLTTTKVELGLANDSYTEVKSGLSEGDVVITGTVDTSTSESSSSGSMFGAMGGGSTRALEGGTKQNFSTEGGRGTNDAGGPPPMQGQ
jgi:multidrug efflux pump subunit AcrA (membrane-fusion protein)